MADDTSTVEPIAQQMRSAVICGRQANVDTKTCEAILRRHDRDVLLQVDFVQESAGSQDGDNYMSVVNRVVLQGVARGNVAFTRTVIAKRQILSISRRKLFRCDEAFSNEIAAYNFVVPMLRRHCNDNVPYPVCYYAGSDYGGEMIMLEDLTQTGYKMGNRLIGLNYDYCKLVFQKLARLHAISMLMKHNAPDDFESIQTHINEIVYCPDAVEFFTHSLESSLREALSSLRASSGIHQLDAIIAKLEKLTGTLYQTMARKILSYDYLGFLVCHGDIWVNNLMFRHNGNNGQVDDVKLIDLQTIRCTSPAIDILHFLYTSTERELRVQHMDTLLQDYHDALMQAVNSFGMEPDVVQKYTDEYSLDRIKMDIDAKALYGLGNGLWILPAVTFDPNNIPDLDEVTLSDFTTANQEKVMAKVQTPAYHRRIRELVVEFNDKGYLDGP